MPLAVNFMFIPCTLRGYQQGISLYNIDKFSSRKAIKRKKNILKLKSIEMYDRRLGELESGSRQD